MFEKILYPTDFSNVSMKACDVIKQLREAGTQEVVILHVIDSRFFDAMAWYITKNMKEIEKDLEREAREQITTIAGNLEAEGLKVKVRIATGIPHSEILRIEDEEKVSAVIIGSHGVSNIQEMFMGSVSEKVIRRAKSLVLVVKR